MQIRAPYLVFLGDVPDALAAKTGQGIVDWRPEAVTGQLRLPGCQADLGVPELTVEQAAARGAKTLVIGAVNPGGVLPSTWQQTIIDALGAGLDVASGLHTRLSHLPDVARAAKSHHRCLFDVRHTDRQFHTGSGVKRPGKRLLRGHRRE